MWYVYIIECANGNLYTGITNDLKRRMQAHAEGKAAKYTRSFGFKKLLYNQLCRNKSSALKKEIRIKQMTRIQKICYMNSLPLEGRAREGGIVSTKKRCGWCTSDAIYIEYHDKEWGRPIHDDRLLFEFLILEGAQAGLSWLTVLKKRDNYRKAFDNFDAAKIARYGDKKTQELLQNEGIIRNRLKIASTIRNAKAFLAVQKEFGSFDKYIWQFVGGKTKKNKISHFKQLPVKTAESDAMSLDLKARGFNFVGTTICYAYMQAVGMVDDHTSDCFCHSLQPLKAIVKR